VSAFKKHFAAVTNVNVPLLRESLTASKPTVEKALSAFEKS